MSTPTKVQETNKGLLITFEGLDGVGKTTQLSILRQALSVQGRDALYIREPGGTALGEEIRGILLNSRNNISPIAELLLFEAARAQLVSEVIKPALLLGSTVICDRFYDSTVAYQGHGRNIGAEITTVANDLARMGIEPDLTLVFDMDPQAAIDRATQEGADRIEQEDRAFRNRIREGFLGIAQDNPSRVRVIDASGTVEQVWRRTRDALSPLFELPENISVFWRR